MGVTDLNDSNFEETLAKEPNVIVKYYADWCGSCKLFSPKFKRLSNDERFANVFFADVNAELNAEARKKASVDNLPFFAVFKNGNLVKAQSTSKEENVLEMLNELLAK